MYDPWDEGVVVYPDYVCLSCRARFPAAWNQNCRELFNTVVQKELSESTTFGCVHTLTVACHVLQHPRQHQPRILSWRLVELCWILEAGGDPSIAYHDSHSVGDDFGRWLDALPVELTAPQDRGQMTILDVGMGRNSEEHGKLVKKWAESVWDAWSRHHRWAKKAVPELVRFYTVGS